MENSMVNDVVENVTDVVETVSADTDISTEVANAAGFNWKGLGEELVIAGVTIALWEGGKRLVKKGIKWGKGKIQERKIRKAKEIEYKKENDPNIAKEAPEVVETPVEAKEE